MKFIFSILDGITRRLGGDKTLERMGSSSDVALAILLIGIVGMIIIPLPSWMLDILIGTNLAVGVTMLMVALYIPSAVNLTVFPSLLLVTTLFRLGINIASTRAVLLYGDAGEIIHAFGSFVVGGEYIVGGIIFVIITIVQFLVITKGSERVAEVAARFTLDAMPGKQMSIDADMRAGTLDADEARNKRLAVQKESQLYGAMDGAMKFVKGDAIAGIIITLINVIGGLAIGVSLRGMDMASAAQKYSLLSIGDGLVSQIPALLISICAGLVITRVSNDDEESNLGREISGQLLKQPKALMITAAVLLGMSFIPGFPRPFFIAGGVAMFLVGYALQQGVNKGAVATGAPVRRGKKGKGTGVGATPTSAETGVAGHKVIHEGGVDEYALTLPVILECGVLISEEVDKLNRGQGFINDMIPKMRMALYADLGVRFPGVHVRTQSPMMSRDEYSIQLNEVPVIRGKVLEGYVLTNESEQNLKRYNLPYTQYKNVLNLPSLWVESKHEELLKRAGIKYWQPLEVVILHLSYFYRHYANEFLGIQEVKAMLEFMEKSFPDLIKEVTRLTPLQKLTDIFKRLIQEQVSIKDLRTILEALADWAQTEKDTVLLTEYVRSSLKRCSRCTCSILKSRIWCAAPSSRPLRDPI